MSAVTARYRLLVLSRIVVAALGGYALASAMAVLLALVWPLPRAEAVMVSTLLSFVWYAVAVIWVFSVRSVLRAWIGILGVTAVLSLLCWLLSGSAP
ncbi:FIG024006: iron uptake protein [plant metagenome]|uniref:FIG024006: iron uptake protein n=1 Tax=plant metagenome TaxID=1297885 RepID=A0A484R5H7_9ZZZZ